MPRRVSALLMSLMWVLQVIRRVAVGLVMSIVTVSWLTGRVMGRRAAPMVVARGAMGGGVTGDVSTEGAAGGVTGDGHVDGGVAAGLPAGGAAGTACVEGVSGDAVGGGVVDGADSEGDAGDARALAPPFVSILRVLHRVTVRPVSAVGDATGGGGAGDGAAGGATGDLCRW